VGCTASGTTPFQIPALQVPFISFSLILFSLFFLLFFYKKKQKQWENICKSSGLWPYRTGGRLMAFRIVVVWACNCKNCLGQPKLSRTPAGSPVLVGWLPPHHLSLVMTHDLATMTCVYQLFLLLPFPFPITFSLACMQQCMHACMCTYFDFLCRSKFIKTLVIITYISPFVFNLLVVRWTSYYIYIIG
jgi:hypothetical protein